MALVNLKSDLAAHRGRFTAHVATDAAKDLTYGKGRAYDRPGQGFSIEPFIKGGINLGWTCNWKIKCKPKTMEFWY